MINLIYIIDDHKNVNDNSKVTKLITAICNQNKFVLLQKNKPWAQ